MNVSSKGELLERNKVSALSLTGDIAKFGTAHLQQSCYWSWQKVTANTVEDVDSLASLLHLDSQALANRVADNDFKLRVPLTFINRMRPGDLFDPLLLQILPQKQEHDDAPGFVRDPLNEQAYNVRPGLVHKYHGRVLLTAAISCPINCRYCFRRHFPYNENRLTPNTWGPAIEYIQQDTSIKEVILSGGEPLLLNDRMIDQLLTEIESIPHVKLIRIHSRFPVVTPQRLTNELCSRLISSRCRVALVLHCNHSNEIDTNLKRHLKVLSESSVTLLNQSVLLYGINDKVSVLSELSENLYDAGVLPYYLHATDPVSGTTHFQVSDAKASQLASALTHELPGYLVPTLVREISDKPAKTRLALSDWPEPCQTLHD